MKLDDYLKSAPRGEAARIARAANVSQTRLSDFRFGRRIPSIEIASRISLETKKQVSPQELRPECDWEKIRRALK